MANQLMDQWRN